MEIKPNSPDYPLDFGVAVEIDNEHMDGPKPYRITLMKKGSLVELNEEECEELLKVLRGKNCFTTTISETKDSYHPHTVIYNSSENQKGYNLDLVREKHSWRKTYGNQLDKTTNL